MIDRRNFIIGAGAVAAAGAFLPSVHIKSAKAAAPSTQAPGFYRTKVGNITVTSLLDGGMDLPEEILTGAKPEDLAALRAKSFIAAGKSFPAYVNGFLIDTGTRLTLVDTGGAGYGPTLGNLAANLAAAGISPDHIDDVILTHAHPDHASGLLDNDGERVFKKANLRLSKMELDYWFDDGKKNGKNKDAFESAQKNIGAYRSGGQIETFALGNDIGNGISSVALPGHTPGHSGIRVSDGSDQLLIWADLVHVPAVQFEYPAQTVSFDVDADLARQSRLKTFDEVAADKIRVAGMHLCFPGVGHVVKKDARYEFMPQMYEIAA